MREVLRSGIDYLNTMTTLLQRMHNAHPSTGLYQAAELHFWWARPRSTDELPQIFWLDDDDLPVAGAATIDFGGGTTSLLYSEPTSVFAFMPDTSPDFMSRAVARALRVFRGRAARDDARCRDARCGSVSHVEPCAR